MCTFLFEEKKIIFDKITPFLDFEILQFLSNTLWQVCIIKPFNSFSAVIQKLCTNVAGMEDVHSLFEEKRKSFWTNLRFSDFEIT